MTHFRTLFRPMAAASPNVQAACLTALGVALILGVCWRRR